MPGPPRSRTAAALLMLAAASCASAPRYPVDGARLHARVVRQVGMGPRVPRTPGHAAVVAWLNAELGRLGARVEVQAFPDTVAGQTLEVRNVRAWFPAAGRRDGGPPRRLLLAAHYDTRPWSDQDPDASRRSLPIAGANDGGSGVAVLLEIAELLSRRPAPVEVELAFFDCEDQGREAHPEEYSRGARGYARRLGADRQVAAFLFDMVGDRDLGIYPEGYSSAHAANLVAMVWEGARLTGARGFQEGIRHNVVDDHIPLIEAGLPTVDIIDLDYPAWHTQADRPDQVSPESLAQVARVAAWLVYDSPLARGR